MSPVSSRKVSDPGARVQVPFTLSDTWTCAGALYWDTHETRRSPCATGRVSVTPTAETCPVENAIPWTKATGGGRVVVVVVEAVVVVVVAGRVVVVVVAGRVVVVVVAGGGVVVAVAGRVVDAGAAARAVAAAVVGDVAAVLGAGAGLASGELPC